MRIRDQHSRRCICDTRRFARTARRTVTRACALGSSRPPRGAGDGGAAWRARQTGASSAGALALRITGGKSSTSCLSAAGTTERAVACGWTRLSGARPPFWRRLLAAAAARPCSRSFLRGPPVEPRAVAVAGDRGDPVIARLCEPSSELHIAEDSYRRTALDDLLGVPAERSTMIGCTARSTVCCRTSKPWRPTSRSAWERCSISTMICCCMM